MKKKAYQAPHIRIDAITDSPLICASDILTVIADENETPPGGWDFGQSRSLSGFEWDDVDNSIQQIITQ